jgi:hypothetical protein
MERTHKKCRDCQTLKPIAKFYSSTRANGKVYHASYCRPCSVERGRKNELKIREVNYLRLWAHFAEHPCLDCGETNPLKLSLDHRGEKNHDISNIMKKKWHHIVAELKLCDVRCHNCHAVKTAASRGHYATESLRDYVAKWPENHQAYKEYENAKR